MFGILHELQRRNVLRAAVLYATSAWALGQGIAALGPSLGAPEWSVRWFLVAAVIGFPFWFAFAWFYEFTPDGIKRESEVDADTPTLRATGRRLDFWIIGALSIAVVLLLTDRFIGHGETSSTNAIAEKSVAVLPLVNESGDANALYFSDGLSEGFINALSRFAGLKVIGRASSFQFRNSKDPVNVIGAKLGVAHLLEGSVQRAGDTVRISAELINASDGTTLWSERYDRPYTDLFKLQDDITNAVATALKAKLLGDGTTLQTDRPPGGNLAAYNAFLEGEFNRLRNTEADFHKAIDAYNTAIQLDPRYAQAYAELSISWIELAGNFLSGTAQQQAYAQARKAADTALALAPNLAGSHNARGALLLTADSDWAGAEAEYRRALQLDPNNVAAKTNLALVLATLGHLEQAVDLTRQALAADPLKATIYSNLTGYLQPLGHLDEAEQAIRKAIELQPAAVSYREVLATIEIQRGDAKAALETARAEPAGALQDIAVAFALQIGANRAAADSALKALTAKHGNDAPYQIAQTYALRKNTNEMFAWLARARTLNDPGLLQLLYDPFILPYRHDPRFAALCKQMKLPVPEG
ncbi:MAG TPA: tetratricopeptide repeat protein [Rhizomicrobium sp.]|jgi:TolB-like protein/Flp pilus assembly protein TadD